MRSHPKALAAAVRTRVAARPDLTAHIRADASVPYQRVLDTMSALSQAGAAHIAFIGQPGQAAAGQPGHALAARRHRRAPRRLRRRSRRRHRRHERERNLGAARRPGPSRSWSRRWRMRRWP